MRRRLLAASALLGLITAVASAARPAAPAATPAAPAATVDLVIHAQELHVGDGSVLTHAAVAIRGGRIVEVAPDASLRSVGRAERRVTTLLPGLLASIVPEEIGDPESANADRQAIASLDASVARGWSEWGITSLVVSPGRRRFVSGRAGLVRLVPDGPEIVLARGAICASLELDAQDPPPLFDPPLHADVDAPIAPARVQRPSTPMAAVAELRRLVSDDAQFDDVRARRVPLRIHADHEEDVRRVISLANELKIDVVLEGGAEAWKLAADLAAAKVLVVLELSDPAAPTNVGRNLDLAPDAAGLLSRAGVDLALVTRRRTRHPDPLFLAASAMRQGVPAAQAIAGISGRLARAVGATNSGLLRAGSPADLAGFNESALALRAKPAFVMVGGIDVSAGSTPAAGSSTDADDAPTAPIALRAGRVLSGKGMLRDGTVLVAGRKIVSVGTSPALPEEATIRDFGSEAVLAPGFIDAFGFAGLEPGTPPSGSSRLRAADAIEAAHPSLRRALRSGVTSAFVAPGARGLLLGSACLVSTAPTKDGTADILAADPAFVFWMDEGPTDAGPRAARLKGLKEFLQKAKGYHEERVKLEKSGKDEKDPKAESGAKPRKEARRGSPKSDEPDPSLEPLRALFETAGKTKAIVRSGRQDVMLEALDAFKGAGLAPILAGAEEADVIATELAKRGVGVILSPRTTRRVDGKVLSVAATLRAAGVVVAIGSFGHGSSDQLPLAACAAVRDGMSAEDALAALTTSAASLVGAADAGRLEAGARADVVAWSGDPMEPTSRVLGVVASGRWIDGVATEVSDSKESSP